MRKKINLKFLQKLSSQRQIFVERWKASSGQLLIEILVVMALMAIITPALIGAIITSQQGSAQRQNRIQAHGLLIETVEALRVIRESNWESIATNGVYHPVVTDSTWTLMAGEETTGLFTRALTISDVMRDETGNIIAEGGTIDPSIKKIDIQISWEQPSSSQISSVIYMTRYLDNLSLIETSEADFLEGFTSGTAVVNNQGGEIILGSGGKGNWCKPSDYIRTELDLPGTGRAKVVRAIEGKAFSGTDGTGGVFVEMDIDQNDPPGVSIANQIAGYDTNDIFIDENYAYIATGDVSKDLLVVDLETGQEVAVFNDTYWWGSAQGVHVSGNVAYMVIGPKLHTVDLTNKSGNLPELDSINLSPYLLWPATGYRIDVKGNYAYVALDFGLREMQIIDVSNPRSLSRVGYANVNSRRGKDVEVNETGTRAYLITDEAGDMRELFIIDTTSKSGSLPLIGTYDTHGMNPRDLALVTENKLIIVGTGGEEYQVVDITDESHPTMCGSLNLDTGVYGVDGVLEQDGEAYSYIVSKDSTSEFKIIEGGAGDSFATTGTYESQYLDAGYATAFNYVMMNKMVPNQTSAKFQVAVADAVNGNCVEPSYIFVGPDGTSSTFFTDEGPIPINDDDSGYENPGRCFKYKVFLETADSSSTPVIDSVTVNYSP